MGFRPVLALVFGSLLPYPVLPVEHDFNRMGGEPDPLAEINDHIRKQGPQASEGSGQWLALESNPEVFNTFCRQIGLPAGWGFVDVLGLDKELLDMVQGPVQACVLLFPCTSALYRERRRQDAILQKRKREPEEGEVHVSAEDLFFLRQVPDFGNACGTIACLHAVANSRKWVALEDGAPLEEFVQAHNTESPEARGRALLHEASLRNSSDAAAADLSAQTVLPARDGPPLDHHFAALVRTPGGRIVELDGTKRGPVDHGPTTAQSFLADAADVVRKHFIEIDPGVNGFSLMALARLPDEEVAPGG